MGQGDGARAPPPPAGPAVSVLPRRGLEEGDGDGGATRAVRRCDVTRWRCDVIVSGGRASALIDSCRLLYRQARASRWGDLLPFPAVAQSDVTPAKAIKSGEE